MREEITGPDPTQGLTQLLYLHLLPSLCHPARMGSPNQVWGNLSPGDTDQSHPDLHPNHCSASV